MREFFNKASKASIRNGLAILVVVGCFILLYLLQVRPIPKENKDVLQIAIGFVFGGALAGVISYYFGATKNESDKIKADRE